MLDRLAPLPHPLRMLVEPALRTDRRCPRDVRFSPKTVEMVHHGECRIALAAKGRMDVDPFSKVPAPTTNHFNTSFGLRISELQISSAGRGTALAPAIDVGPVIATQ
jgi:hypothetical protein